MTRFSSFASSFSTTSTTEKSSSFLYKTLLQNNPHLSSFLPSHAAFVTNQPQTILITLLQTIYILHVTDSIEPLLSSCHLLAFAMDPNHNRKKNHLEQEEQVNEEEEEEGIKRLACFQWENNGFVLLFQMMEEFLSMYQKNMRILQQGQGQGKGQIMEDDSIHLHPSNHEEQHILQLLSYFVRQSEECHHNNRETLTTQALNMTLTHHDSFFHSPHVVLSSAQVQHLANMIQRRIQKEPLQYIFGKWDFYDLTLQIRSPCLCPRPETEELIEFLCTEIQERIDMNVNDAKIRILDVGCGTGAIGIVLAHRFPKHVQVVAIDRKKEAIELSQENARRILLPKVQFVSSSEKNKNSLPPEEHDQDGLLSSLYTTILASASDFTNQNNNTNKYDFKFDIIVSNPPYIPLGDMATLTEDVRNYEDFDALCGGLDGMDVIRDILQRLDEWSTSCPSRKPVCWMEVDTSHPQMLQSMLSSSKKENHNSNQNQSQKHVSRYVQFVAMRKDLSGKERFVKLSLENVK